MTNEQLANLLREWATGHEVVIKTIYEALNNKDKIPNDQLHDLINFYRVEINWNRRRFDYLSGLANVVEKGNFKFLCQCGWHGEIHQSSVFGGWLACPLCGKRDREMTLQEIKHEQEGLEDKTLCLGRGCTLTNRCARYSSHPLLSKNFIVNCVSYTLPLKGTDEDYQLFIEQKTDIDPIELEVGDVWHIPKGKEKGNWFVFHSGGSCGWGAINTNGDYGYYDHLDRSTLKEHVIRWLKNQHAKLVYQMNPMNKHNG